MPAQSNSTSQNSARGRSRQAVPDTRRGRRPPPANEDAHGRFQRIATRRANKALVYIRLLRSLAASRYKPTEAEVQQLSEVLQTELDASLKKLQERVTQRGAAEAGAFRFAAEH